MNDRRRLNTWRTDELQERLVPLDDRIYGGRGCGFGALGGSQTEASSHDRESDGGG
jgi:hypothetical protein